MNFSELTQDKKEQIRNRFIFSKEDEKTIKIDEHGRPFLKTLNGLDMLPLKSSFIRNSYHIHEMKNR